MDENDLNSFFGSVTVNADGTSSYKDSVSTTTVKRSNVLFVPALSTIAIHITGTASVTVKTSPFGDSSKEFTVSTVTANTQIAVPNANYYVLDVTAVTGTVTAALVANED